LDGQDGRDRLYDAEHDWLQRHDLQPRDPALARRLLSEAEKARQFNDYLLRHGRVWPRRAP
jgi:hypothetical protein